MEELKRKATNILQERSITGDEKFVEDTYALDPNLTAEGFIIDKKQNISPRAMRAYLLLLGVLNLKSYSKPSTGAPEQATETGTDVAIVEEESPETISDDQTSELNDFYETLGVDKYSSQAEIKSAYRKLSKQYHPDFNPGDLEAEEMMKEVNIAYTALSGRENRANYDEYREQQSQTTPKLIQSETETGVIPTGGFVYPSTGPGQSTGGQPPTKARLLTNSEKSMLLYGARRLTNKDPKIAFATLATLKEGVLGRDFAREVAVSNVLDDYQKGELKELAEIVDAFQDEFPAEKRRLIKESAEFKKRVFIEQRKLAAEQRNIIKSYLLTIEGGQKQNIIFDFVQTQVAAAPGMPIQTGQAFQLPSINFPSTGPLGDMIRSPLERIGERQLSKIRNKVYKKLGIKALKKTATKAVAKTAARLSAKLGIKAALHAGLQAFNVVPGLGVVLSVAGEVAMKALSVVAKNAKKATKYVAAGALGLALGAVALGGALLAALAGVVAAVFGQALVIVLVIFPVLVAIILFIINTSAFLVPYGPEVGGGTPGGGGGGGGASGSCPVRNHDTSHYQLSYDAPPETGHGSNDYYNTIYGTDRSIWPCTRLPVTTQCRSPNVPGSSQNECSLRNLTPSCSEYGYALDVFPTTDLGVYLPDISDNWSFRYSIPNSNGNGWGVTYSGGIYNILFLHLNEDVETGTDLRGGQRIGTLFDQSDPERGTDNTHIHIELTANGISRRPEDYMCGFVTPGGDADGWLIRGYPVSSYQSGTYDQSLNVSRKGEYGIDYCTYAGRAWRYATEAAIPNAVGYSIGVSTEEPPLGRSGVSPDFTYNDMNIPWSSLVVKQTSPTYTSIIGKDEGFANPSFMTSGVDAGSAVASTVKMPRTIFGLLDSDQVLAAVLKNATADEAEQVMLSEGVSKDNILHFTIGSATHLCEYPDYQATERIFPKTGGRIPTNALGFAGEIEDIYLDGSPGPVPGSCEDVVEIDTGNSETKLFSSSDVVIPTTKTVNSLNNGLDEFLNSIPSGEKSARPAHLFILDSCQDGIFKELHDDLVARGIDGMTINSKPDSIKSHFASCMPNCMFIRSSSLNKSEDFLTKLVLHESRHMVQGYNNPNFRSHYWLNGIPNGTATSYAAFLEAYADDGPDLDGNIMEGSYFPCRIDYLRSLPELTDASIDGSGRGNINYYNEMVAIYNASYETERSFEELFPINFRASSNEPDQCQ